MITYQEFRDSIKKVSTKRNHRIKNSYGVDNYYSYYRTHSTNKIDQKLYRQILHQINLEIIEQLFYNKIFSLPKSLGTISIVKEPLRFCMYNNKLVSNRGVNWDRTLKLWYEDKDAYSNRVIVRKEYQNRFKFKYRQCQSLKNCRYIRFIPNRYIKLKLQRLVSEEDYDTFI